MTVAMKKRSKSFKVLVVELKYLDKSVSNLVLPAFEILYVEMLSAYGNWKDYYC